MFKGVRCVDYSDEHFEKAFEEIQTFGADMGGTEILPPLQEIFCLTQE
jgi:hypothetical protein